MKNNDRISPAVETKQHMLAEGRQLRDQTSALFSSLLLPARGSWGRAGCLHGGLFFWDPAFPGAPEALSSYFCTVATARPTRALLEDQHIKAAWACSAALRSPACLLRSQSALPACRWGGGGVSGAALKIDSPRLHPGSLHYQLFGLGKVIY